MEVESIKKTQTVETLVIKNLGTRTRTLQASFTGRIQVMEERISVTEGKEKKMIMPVKENVKSKTLLGHLERAKAKNNSSRGRRKNPG